MLTGIIILNTTLDVILLHESVMNSWSLLSLIFRLLISNFIDHLAFTLSVGLILVIRNDVQMILNSAYSKYYRKLYFALAFPEYLRTIAIILQLFDSETEILTLLSLLLLSIQCQSIQSFTGKPFHRILVAIIFGALIRISIRSLLYEKTDLNLLYQIILWK